MIARGLNRTWPVLAGLEAAWLLTPFSPWQDAGQVRDWVGDSHLDRVASAPSGGGFLARTESLELNGSSQYAKSSDNAALSCGDTNFTIASFVRPSNFSAHRIIAQKGWQGSPDSNSEYVLYFASSTGAITFSVRSSSTGTLTGSAATANVWVMVFAWHSADDDQLGLALNDGSATTASRTQGVNDGSRDFQLGASSPQSLWFLGEIGPTFFFRRVLDSSERALLYYDALAGFPQAIDWAYGAPIAEVFALPGGVRRRRTELQEPVFEFSW